MNKLNGAGAATNDQEQLSLKIDRLYVKEISCRIPHAPGLYDSTEFKENMGQMTSSVEMNIKTQAINKEKFEVVLHVVIHAKVKNLSLFVLEVQQAGIFTLLVPKSYIEAVIKHHCIGFLHPYLSQVVTNTIVQAGFPPIVLHPMQPNFDQRDSSEKESSFNSFNHTKDIVEPTLS